MCVSLLAGDITSCMIIKYGILEPTGPDGYVGNFNFDVIQIGRKVYCLATVSDKVLKFVRLSSILGSCCVTTCITIWV